MCTKREEEKATFGIKSQKKVFFPFAIARKKKFFLGALAWQSMKQGLTLNFFFSPFLKFHIFPKEPPKETGKKGMFACLASFWTETKGSVSNDGPENGSSDFNG